MSGSAYLDWLAAAVSPPPGPAAPPAAGRDLVLGYATGYRVADVEAFVRSLRAVYAGPAALVVDPDPDLLAFLGNHEVEAVTACAGSAWRPHPVVARFAAYARLLEERPDVRSAVITDVRDVVFQDDPFADPVRELEFFIEHEAEALSGHPFNIKHLRALFGEGLTRALRPRPCICVGVVAGPAPALVRFCRLLLMLCAIPRSRVGGDFGADQAACNAIAHLGLLDAALRPNYGRVATIGMTPAAGLRVEGDRILNPDGGVSPIVHQYDRKPPLARFVRERWGSPDDRPLAGRRATAGERLRRSVLRRLPEWR